MDNLLNAIKDRHSTRTFSKKSITEASLNELKTFISENDKGLNGEQIALSIVETIPESDKKMRLNYGIIKNNHTYLLGEVKDNLISRMNYGYVMEKAILKATELGIGSCWIGYFDAAYFKDFNIVNSGNIPAIAILGYASETPSFSNRIIKTLIKASSRKEWEGLFFENSVNTPLSKNLPQAFIQALEMLRWAPSAGNTQPWRVIFNESSDTFHFFKLPISKRYENDGLHDIDLGIALSHFDIALSANKIKGRWLFESNVAVENGLNYMISWKRDN